MFYAVDLGGTQLRAAAVSEAGEVLSLLVTPTPAGEGPQAVADTLCAQVRRLPGFDTAEALGVGVPGGVERDGSGLHLCSNLPGMTGYPLKRRLEESLGVPCTLLNDADAACLGESLLGSGRGYNSCCYITVSTGIGGGYCRDGRLLTGAHGSAAEFGSLSVFTGRPRLGELPPGACESYLSGTALTSRARELTGRPIAHAGEVFRGAAQDPVLGELTRDFVAGMAALLSDLACVLDPGCFVLGGGCMKSRDFFFSDMIAAYRDFTAQVYRDTPILPAGLPEPGLVGAALAGCRKD